MKMAFCALYLNIPYTQLPLYFMVEQWYNIRVKNSEATFAINRALLKMVIAS
jgi:hypothetical protein